MHSGHPANAAGCQRIDVLPPPSIPLGHPSLQIEEPPCLHLLHPEQSPTSPCISNSHFSLSSCSWTFQPLSTPKLSFQLSVHIAEFGKMFPFAPMSEFTVPISMEPPRINETMAPRAPCKQQRAPRGLSGNNTHFRPAAESPGKNASSARLPCEAVGVRVFKGLP